MVVQSRHAEFEGAFGAASASRTTAAGPICAPEPFKAGPVNMRAAWLVLRLCLWAGWHIRVRNESTGMRVCLRSICTRRYGHAAGCSPGCVVDL